MISKRGEKKDRWFDGTSSDSDVTEVTKEIGSLGTIFVLNVLEIPCAFRNECN